MARVATLHLLGVPVPAVLPPAARASALPPRKVSNGLKRAATEITHHGTPVSPDQFVSLYSSVIGKATLCQPPVSVRHPGPPAAPGPAPVTEAGVGAVEAGVGAGGAVQQRAAEVVDALGDGVPPPGHAHPPLTRPWEQIQLCGRRQHSATLRTVHTRGILAVAAEGKWSLELVQ